MEIRTCTVCKCTKSLTDFYPKSAARGGFTTACKGCIIEKSKKHYAANKEKIKSRITAYKKSDPERLARWRKNEYGKNYTLRSIATRRVRALTAGGRHTKKDIEEIYIEQRGLCVYCKDPLKEGRHKDHIMPLKLGGTHHRENIQLLCPTCSLRKNALHPDIFAKQINEGRI